MEIYIIDRFGPVQPLPFASHHDCLAPYIISRNKDNTPRNRKREDHSIRMEIISQIREAICLQTIVKSRPGEKINAEID